MFDLPTNLVVGVIFGGIAAYLLTKGILGFKRKYMITANPDADGFPLSPTNAVFSALRDVAREKLGPPVAFDRGPTTKVTGSDLYIRVVMYIGAGLVFLFVGVVLTVPGAAEVVGSVLGL